MLAAFLCICPLASFPVVLLAYRWCIHTAVSIRPLLGRNCVSFFRSSLVDKFTYLGSNVSSTEKDIDTRLTKAWTAIDKLSVIWKYIYIYIYINVDSALFGIAYDRNYINLAKTFLLRQFTIAENQSSSGLNRQTYIMKFWLSEKCRSCEIYKRLRVEYGAVGLIWFHGISTIVGYSISNPPYIYI